MFKKTYLSRAMSRAYSMDAPIGDPFGGPAYGERNDPVTAVATFFEAATAFETIAAIGTAISVVGMVTGNGDLAKIGGVMGLVGGFGAMAQGGMFGPDMAKWAESTNSVFSSAASNISSAATPVDGMTASQVQSMAEVGGTGSATIEGAGSQLNLAQTSNAAIPAVESQAVNTMGEGGIINTTPAVDPASNMLNPDGTPKGVQPQASTPAATGAPTSSSNPALSIANAGEPINAMQATAQQGGNLAQIKAASSGVNTGTSLFDKISNFANNNKALTEMALKGVASMYVSPQDKAYKEAQTTSANAIAGLYDAKAAEIQGQMANANAIPNVQGQFSVNKNAQVYNKPPVTAAGVRPAGLIQSRSA